MLAWRRRVAGLALEGGCTVKVIARVLRAVCVVAIICRAWLRIAAAVVAPVAASAAAPAPPPPPALALSAFSGMLGAAMALLVEAFFLG